MDLEEIPYDTWLKEKLGHEKKIMENGFRTMAYAQDQVFLDMGEVSNEDSQGPGRMGRHHRVVRRVSQVRRSVITVYKTRVFYRFV